LKIPHLGAIKRCEAVGTSIPVKICHDVKGETIPKAISYRGSFPAVDARNLHHFSCLKPSKAWEKNYQTQLLGGIFSHQLHDFDDEETLKIWAGTFTSRSWIRLMAIRRERSLPFPGSNLLFWRATDDYHR